MSLDPLNKAIYVQEKTRPCESGAKAVTLTTLWVPATLAERSGHDALHHTQATQTMFDNQMGGLSHFNPIIPTWDSAVLRCTQSLNGLAAWFHINLRESSWRRRDRTMQLRLPPNMEPASRAVSTAPEPLLKGK